jgi:hypothetical protein
LLIANGIDPVMRWDGMTSELQLAGIAPPDQPITLSQSGAGNMTGVYYAYLRYVDAEGNYSNLSPLAGPITMAGSYGKFTGTPSGTNGEILTSLNHGLLEGSTILIDNVKIYSGSFFQGGTGIFNTATAMVHFTVHVIDKDHISLSVPAAADTNLGMFKFTGSGALDFTVHKFVQTWVPEPGMGWVAIWSQAGVIPVDWTSGAGQIEYDNVEIPDNPRVVRRQILRNTYGQASTFFVDVDTTDLTSTTFFSHLTDDELALQQAVVLNDANGNPIANQYGVPPNDKSILLSALGRMFYLGEVQYKQGCVAVVFGSTTVQGIGTEWPDKTFVGRWLYVKGAGRYYQIAALDHVNQIATLDQPYVDPTNPYATYTIRPPEGERRTIYFSSAGLPEAVSPLNGITLMEDGDDITGGLNRGSYIYFLERKHIYRFSFQQDPVTDGYVFLSTNRGCVNNRCWVVVDDVAYMLDEGGVHAFSTSGDAQPLSQMIQDIFEADDGAPHHTKINWEAKDHFHAVHNPSQETIRWFVALAGHYLPRHALVYHYRSQRWWVEQWPFNVGASALGELNDQPQVYLGGPAGKIYAYGQGRLDGPVAGSGTLQSTVTGATVLSLTDIMASFPASGLVGSPVAMVNGAGQGQQRTIVAVNGTELILDRPWLELPQAGDIYQIGGIQWLFRSGWFRWAEDEQQHPRRLEVVFEPTNVPMVLNALAYLNRSVLPILWTNTYPSSAMNQFSSTKGSPYLVADLTKQQGMVQRRIDAQREYYVDGRHFLQIEINGIAQDDLVRIYSMNLDGYIK